MKNNNAIKQNYWVLVLIFISFSVGLILAGIYLYNSEKEINKSEFERKLQAISNLKTGQLKKWRNEKFFDANTLVSNPLVKEELLNLLDNPNSNSRLNKVGDILNNYIIYGEYKAAFIFNSKRNSVYSSGDLGYDISELDSFYFKEEPGIKDFFISEFDKKIYLDLVIPIDTGKNTSGLIILRIDPAKYLYPLIQQWPAPNKTAETVLIRSEGNSIVYLNELRHKKNTALTYRLDIDTKELPAAVAVKNNFEGTLQGKDYRQTSVLANINKVSGTPWILITKIDTDEIFEATADLALFVSVIVLVLITLTGIGLGFYWVRQNRKNYKLLYEAEREKQSLQKYYNYLFKHANDSILIEDMEGNILDANDVALKSYGYTYEEMCKLNVRDIRTPSENLLLPGHIKQIKEKGAIIFETKHTRKDGKVFPVEASSILLSINGQDLIQNIVRDITERKEADKIIRENEDLLKKILESLPIGVWIVDENGKIIQSNPTAVKIWQGAKYIGMDKYGEYKGWWLKTGKPVKPDEWASARAISKGEISINEEIEIECFDGSRKIILNSAIPIHNPDGSLRGAIVTNQDITKIKIAENALRESEEIFNQFLENSPIYIFFKDEEIRSVKLSRNYEKMLGRPLEELLGKTMDDLFPSELAKSMIKDDQKILRERKIINVDEELDGRNYVTTKFPIIIDNHSKFLAGYTIDITDQKKAREALAESEVHFRNLADSGQALTWTAGTDKKCDYFNKIWLDFTGRSLEQELGNGWTEGVHPDDFDRCVKIYSESFDRREKFSMDYRLRRYDGEYRWIQDDGSPRYDSRGEFIGYIGHCLDITDRKLAEEEIENSQNYFRNLIENAPDGITLISAEGKFLYNSPSALRIFGYNPEDITGELNPDDLTHPEDLSRVLTTLNQVVQNPASPITIEYRFKHKDGSYRWIESTFTNLLSEPSVQAIVINFRDITVQKSITEERKKLNEELEIKVSQRTQQLESANKELEAFSYSVSHDLRSPLRAISGFTKILLEDYYDSLNDEIKDLLDDILKNTFDMNQLIDDLLQFSRLSRKEISQSALDMTRLFEQTFTEYKNLIPDRRIEFKIDTLPEGSGDYALVKQVVRNLVSNALKFTSKNSITSISIQGKENGYECVYSIKDNGVGFDMKYANKIFGVFQRLHSKADFDGTGVGLAIVQRIICRHGGKVWVKSEIGKGTTFYFTLLKPKERT